jgi:hypothetical protein
MAESEAMGEIMNFKLSIPPFYPSSAVIKKLLPFEVQS